MRPSRSVRSNIGFRSATARPEQRHDYADQKDDNDDNKRGFDGDFDHVAEQHLHPQNQDDRGESIVQEMEHLHEAGDREVKRPQAEQSEDIRSVDDDRIGGDGEDSRDRINGEDNVGRLDGQQHDE